MLSSCPVLRTDRRSRRAGVVSGVVVVPIFLVAAQRPAGGGEVFFVRGDADANGRLELTDAVRILRGIFLSQPLPCHKAADVDDRGTLELTDGVFLLNHLFRGGLAPPAPHPLCGPDPTADDLSCESFPACTCGGFRGAPCDRGEYCDVPPGMCHAADIPGTCVPVPGGCPEIWDPVCGCDGQTYGNDCERIMAGVQKDHDGECKGPQVCGGIAGIPCDPGETCDLPAGLCEGADLQGECVPVPALCLAVWDPVCGCDGRTYGNDCERIRAGVQKDHDGECAGD